jgi:hypothetical protein
MNYKNIYYNYLHNFFSNVIFKKEKGINKYIFVYNLPTDMEVSDLKLLKDTLRDNGFIVKIVKTKLLLKYLRERVKSSNNPLFPLIFGNILIATNKNNDFVFDLTSMEASDTLLPSAIINDDGFIFHSSFASRLPELKSSQLNLKVRNNIITPLVKLRQVLVQYNKINS